MPTFTEWRYIRIIATGETVYAEYNDTKFGEYYQYLTNKGDGLANGGKSGLTAPDRVMVLSKEQIAKELAPF